MATCARAASIMAALTFTMGLGVSALVASVVLAAVVMAPPGVWCPLVSRTNWVSSTSCSSWACVASSTAESRVSSLPSRVPPMTARSAVTQPDEMMTRIGHGIELSQSGHRDQARRLFAELWEQIGPQGDALLRCALAHSMADVQDDPHDEHLGPEGFAGCGHGERRTNSQRQRTTRDDLPQLPPDDAALAEDLRHPVSVARSPPIMYQERVLSPVVTGRTVTPRSCPVPGVT